MRWSIIRLIWLRELRDQLRDRRTLFMIAVLPMILYPLLGFGAIKIALGFAERPAYIGLEPGPRGSLDFPESPEQDFTQPAYPLLIKNGAFNAPGDLPPLEAALLGEVARKVRFVFLDTPAHEALSQGEVAIVLRVPADFYDGLKKGETGAGQPTLDMLGNFDEDRAQQALRRLQPLLDLWKSELKKTRLERLRLPHTLDEPFQVKKPEQSRGGPEPVFRLMIRIFPFMLVMWSLAGALYPAVDLCAGEKERGTMETLLISPAGREEIVLGKFLTIWVFSGGTAYLNLLSMTFTTSEFGKHYGQGALPLASILWCMVLLLPLSAFFSAISLAIGAYARSSKEGQYYLMPLFLVTMPLIFLTLAPGVELNPFYSLVPVTGVALLMQKLMTATSLAQVPWLYFIPVLAPIALYSALALRWAIDQFHREEVLFREAERLDIRLWLRRLLQEKQPTPTTGQAFFLFALILALHWLSLGLGGQLGIAAQTAISLLAFVATPPLFMSLILNTQLGESLKLALPSWRSLGLAALLAVLLMPPVATLAYVVYQSPGFARLLEERQPLVFVFQTFGQHLDQESLALGLLVFAFLPAVCEEIAFRGFILTGLLKHFRPRTAVVLTSFLYALFHMNVFQFLPSFFLGMILGLLTIRSRSIYPAMMFHFLYYSVLLVGIHLVDLVRAWVPLEWRGPVRSGWLCWVGFCAALAGWLLWRLYRKPYVELEQFEQRLAQENDFPSRARSAAE